MIRNFAVSSLVDRIRATVLFTMTVIVAASVADRTAASTGSGCNRAGVIVSEVRSLPLDTAVAQRDALSKLEIAQKLCPGMAKLWQLSHCIALSLGDQQKADFYRKRASLSGVREIRCTASQAGSVTRPPPLPSYVRQKFALVVGIGSFMDPKITTLRYTAKDAADFADFLVDYGHFNRRNVDLLVDEAASRANILKKLNSLILKAQEDDLVVVYVSSHGSPRQEGQGLGGIGYLVTHDSYLSEIYVDAIDYQDFAEKVATIKARRIVTFLDTCFSGQAFAGEGEGAKQLVIGGVGVGDQTAELFLSGEGTYVITSSREDEKSWESDDLKNGYFTHYLIEALKSPGEPPTIKEVFEKLSYQVTRAVARDKGVGQHPQMHPMDDVGNVKIGVVPKLALDAGDP